MRGETDKVTCTACGKSVAVYFKSGRIFEDLDNDLITVTTVREGRHVCSKKAESIAMLQAMSED